MNILEVVHGYPPQYNAGSENYTETTSNEFIRKGHKVSVFCREENPFRKEYELTETNAETNTKIRKFTINIYRNKDRFLNKEVDNAFRSVLEKTVPDIVHIEHLNHLSLGIPSVIEKMGIPTVYTLHDFWLMCPRGQFLQYNTTGTPWKNCDGQEDVKCASVCYDRYHTGQNELKNDILYWTDWINKRMTSVKEMIQKVQYFISPSNTVLNSFRSYFPEAKERIIYLDYGFDLNKLKNRTRIRNKDEPYVFGYIGTHIPAKGVDQLIKAFGSVKGKTILRIWGRDRGEYTPYLKKLSQEVGKIFGNKIEWMGEFDSEKIIEQVFNNVDCIVVPSIWFENSPLVIHEAQQARVPVITANTGGMAEYVKHGVNGLLYDFRDVGSLSHSMQDMVNTPSKADLLGKTGYLYDKDGNVQSIDSHVSILEEVFRSLITSQG